jgi:hypothetical protein
MYWDRFISEYVGFPLIRLIPSFLHTFFLFLHSLTCSSVAYVTIEWVKIGQWGEDRTKTLYL